MLSALAAVAAAFTLQTAPESAATEAVCQVNQSPVQACQIAMAEQQGATGIFFNIGGNLIGFVGEKVTDTKISVAIVGINDQAAPVDSGSCQVSQGVITCTATLGDDTLTVRGRPTQ